MSFHDTIHVDELCLTNHIELKADDGEWVTGKVIELALLADEDEHRITLMLDNGTVLRLDRKPSHPVTAVYLSDT